MALDPQVRAVLDMMAALELPELGSGPPEEQRARMAAMREANPVPVQDVASLSDISVPGPGGAIPVRVYRPSDEAGRPLVVFFHGGGWVIGDLESHDGTCRALANASGAVVAAVDYRLAPEHPFPAAVEDAVAATRWLVDHAGDLGADGSRVAVAGDSAGGNLAAVVAITARDAGGPDLAFQLLVYPATDARGGYPSLTENAQGYLLTENSMRWFYGHYAPDPADWRASPILADLSGLPPALVMTAGFDPLRDEGAAYAEALRAAGVEAELINYEGMIHGFFGMSNVLDVARDAQKTAGQALAARLG